MVAMVAAAAATAAACLRCSNYDEMMLIFVVDIILES